MSLVLPQRKAFHLSSSLLLKFTIFIYRKDFYAPQLHFSLTSNVLYTYALA